MNREEKGVFVDDVRARFAAAPFVILASYEGCTVAELDKVRRACEPQGIHFRVVKNTLCRRAIAGTKLEPLGAKFKGPVAVMFSSEDAIATAKLFRSQAGENEKLKLQAGFFEGDVLDAKGVEMVATLPSKEELLAKLLGTIQESPRQLLSVLQGPSRDLLFALTNYAAKLAD